MARGLAGLSANHGRNPAYSILIGQQLNGAQQTSNDSSGGAGDVSSKAVSTAVQPLSLTSAAELDAVSIVMSVKNRLTNQSITR